MNWPLAGLLFHDPGIAAATALLVVSSLEELDTGGGSSGEDLTGGKANIEGGVGKVDGGRKGRGDIGMEKKVKGKGKGSSRGSSEADNEGGLSQDGNQGGGGEHNSGGDGGDESSEETESSDDTESSEGTESGE